MELRRLQRDLGFDEIDARIVRQPFTARVLSEADLDATLAKVQELGGSTVMPPADVPGGPRLAQFADLDGNVIGLTQSGTMQGA